MAARLPPIGALSGFEAASRLGSFTKAAEELRLTQGAVSRQVQQLESHLGLPLFERSRRGLRLTPAGHAYIEEIRPLLHRLQLATDHVRTHPGRAGVLTLSVPPTFGSYWLVPRLPGFIARHPEVTLHLSTRVGAQLDLQHSALDAAILYTVEPPAGCVATTVLPLTLHPYAAPRLLRHAPGQGAGRLAHLPLLESTTLPQAWPQWLRRAGVDERGCRYGPLFELLSHGLAAAIGGVGAALLPAWVAAGAVRARRLQRVAPVGLTTAAGYRLCFRSEFADRPALLKLRQWLSEDAGAPHQGRRAPS